VSRDFCPWWAVTNGSICRGNLSCTALLSSKYPAAPNVNAKDYDAVKRGVIFLEKRKEKTRLRIELQTTFADGKKIPAPLPAAGAAKEVING
jgi:hypothetical protein